MSETVEIRRWTCSCHGMPDKCEECGSWHCDECEVSEWVVVGRYPSDDLVVGWMPHVHDHGWAPDYALKNEVVKSS